MMALVFRSLVLALALALVTAVPSVGRGSAGNSDATIVFGETRHGNAIGTSSQAGQTSASSEQRTSGAGQQTNQGEASAVSTQQQTGLGGATQSTRNQGVVQALQASGGGGGDGGGGGSTSQQSSNNQINIVSNQEQQNVEGTLINVHGGNEGVVVVNTNQNARSALGGGARRRQQQPASHDENTLLNIMNNNNEIVFVITANKTEEEEEEPIPSSNCRYICIRPTNNTPYCCDDGTRSNSRRRPAIHGGQCPPLRLLCTRFVFFRKCAHDGQCAPSDKCCYDDCVDHHICKKADPIP